LSNLQKGLIWTTHEEYFVVYHCAKFGNDRCSCLRKFQFLEQIAGKCLFMTPKLGFKAYDPLSGVQYQPKPKMAHLAFACVI